MIHAPCLTLRLLQVVVKFRIYAPFGASAALGGACTAGGRRARAHSECEASSRPNTSGIQVSHGLKAWPLGSEQLLSVISHLRPGSMSESTTQNVVRALKHTHSPQSWFSGPRHGVPACGPVPREWCSVENSLPRRSCSAVAHAGALLLNLRYSGGRPCRRLPGRIRTYLQVPVPALRRNSYVEYVPSSDSEAFVNVTQVL